MIERVVLVHSDRGQDVDGIRDHTLRLAKELSRRSIDVEVRLQAPADARRLHRLGDASAVVLQYSPFCFARWGFAPALPAAMLATRAKRTRPALAVMVHEPYVPMSSWRWALMGLWQRLQLWAVRLSADVIFTSIDPWAVKFSAGHPRRRVHHLPVGSNIPDARSRREETRRKLEADNEMLVVATLGSGHPSWLAGHAIAAANAIAASGRSILLLSLGAHAPALPELDAAIAVRAPGYLEAGDLAAQLAASDIFLAPLIDGVSTRRGSMMAALQHALPVVGTSGPLTDSILREASSAICLSEVGDMQEFGRSAVRLANNPGARESIGVDARQLYERNFDWPVIADNLLAGLAER